MRLILLSFLLAFVCALTSCKKYKPAETAFFLKADPVTVNPKPSQGTGDHKITDLGVYVNGQFQGTYPINSLLPIVSKGEPVRINILAGIKNNGISDTRVFWPFYDLLQIDTVLPGGTTHTIPITFSYNPSTVFAWQENFDSAVGYTIKRSAISETSFSIAPASESFEGNSAELLLNNGMTIGQLESSESGYPLPSGSSNVFLEFNYRSNEEFSVGLIDDSGILRPALNINPQTSWNKIYVQLSFAVNSPAVAKNYKVYFRMLKKTADTPRLLLDNIKLVYLK